MRHYQTALLAGLALSLSACHTFRGDYPRNTTVVPDTHFRLLPSYSLALEDAILIAGVTYLVYLVVDPTAPAWEIHETVLADNRVRYSMKMQRIHGGGDGEARQVLARRAEALAREKGFAGYQISHYEESIDSRIFLPRRTAEAEILLTARSAISR